MNDVLPAAIWRPVGAHRLVLRLPDGIRARGWIRRVCGPGTRPEWNPTTQRWEVARRHFRAVVEAFTDRFGMVDVFVDSRAVTKCDTRCRDAEGDECGCQCLGENHGGAAYWRYWVLVGDTTLVTSGGITRRRLRVARPLALVTAS